MKFLLIFFISLILTILITPYLIRLLRNKGHFDLPGDRKIHIDKTPRMGGVVLFVVLITLLLIFYADIIAIKYMIFGSIVIFICGILDDLYDLSWPIKLFIQSIASLLLLIFLNTFIVEVKLFTIIIIYPFDQILLFIFILGVINSVNFLDGMDGLVSGYSLLNFIIILVLGIYKNDTLLILVSSIFIGSVIGFLKFNAHPAKIFLGDSGSLFIGFLLAFVSIKAFTNFRAASETITNLDIAFPIILLSIPIIDSTRVVSQRLFNKTNPFLPDTNHLHHVIYHTRISHKRAVFIIHLFSIIFAGLALYYIQNGPDYILILAYTLSLTLLVFAKPGLSFLANFEIISKVKALLLFLPSFIINTFKKYFLIISPLFVGIIIFKSISTKSFLELDYIIFLLVIGIIMIMVAHFHNKITTTINGLYFFFNVSIFFLFNNSLHIFNSNGATDLLIKTGNIFLITIILLALLITFFIVVKDRLNINGTLFTGIELIILVVIAMLISIRELVGTINIDAIVENLVIAFILYLWYKIIIHLKPNLNKNLFYGSFVISFISILISLLSL